MIEILRARSVARGASLSVLLRGALSWLSIVGAIAFEKNHVFAADRLWTDNAAWSVKFFNEQKASWDQFAGESIRVEGRLGASGKGQLRLVKCELSFVVSDSLIRQLGNSKSVEVTGKIKKDGSKIHFEVNQLKAIPTDIERFDSFAAKHRNSPAADWYSLGDEALSRSQFYDDAELAKKAVIAYGSGVKAEERALADGDGEARIKLAEKVRQYKLPEVTRIQLLHDGYRLVLQAASKKEPVEVERFDTLAAQILKDLPGSGDSPKVIDLELKQKYEKDGLATYREASEELRPRLHRLLYSMVVLKPILLDADADGRNGDFIAARILKVLPEEIELADRFRERRRVWRIDRAAAATRQEIEALASELRSAKQEVQAQKILKTWLDAREARAREDGSVGLLQHAEDRLALLRDEAAAVSLLKEAHKLDPSFEDVIRRLTTLGYKLEAGAWVKASARPMQEPNVGGGNIEIGMTASQLLAIQQRRPSSISRTITAAGVTEIWFYESGNLIFRLEKTGTAREAKLVEIGNGALN